MKKIRKYMGLRTKYYRTAGLPVSLKATNKQQHFRYRQQVWNNLLGSKVFSNTLKSNWITTSNVFNPKVSIKKVAAPPVNETQRRNRGYGSYFSIKLVVFISLPLLSMESFQAEGHLSTETRERGSYFQFTVVDQVHYLIKKCNKCTYQIFPLH